MYFPASILHCNKFNNQFVNSTKKEKTQRKASQNISMNSKSNAGKERLMLNADAIPAECPLRSTFPSPKLVQNHC